MTDRQLQSFTEVVIPKLLVEYEAEESVRRGLMVNRFIERFKPIIHSMDREDAKFYLEVIRIEYIFTSHKILR